MSIILKEPLKSELPFPKEISGHWEPRTPDSSAAVRLLAAMGAFKCFKPLKFKLQSKAIKT